MRLIVAGVKRVTGTAKESGNAFDMCRLLALVPIEAGGNAKFQASGYGYELAEISMLPEALPAFAGLKFPSSMELETDSRPFRGKLETIVTGVRPAAAVKAA